MKPAARDRARGSVPKRICSRQWLQSGMSSGLTRQRGARQPRVSAVYAPHRARTSALYPVDNLLATVCGKFMWRQLWCRAKFPSRRRRNGLQSREDGSTPFLLFVLFADTGNITLHMDCNWRDADDCKIPDYRELNGPASASGCLPHSDTNEKNIDIGERFNFTSIAIC